MPRELRVSISITVPLPDNPTRMACVIMGVDKAIDDLRLASGGHVEYESEIVTPRRREESAPSGGLVVGPPRVEVPPMDPAPVVEPPDLLDIPAFLDRRSLKPPAVT